MKTFILNRNYTAEVIGTIQLSEAAENLLKTGTMYIVPSFLVKENNTLEIIDFGIVPISKTITLEKLLKRKNENSV